MQLHIKNGNDILKVNRLILYNIDIVTIATQLDIVWHFFHSYVAIKSADAWESSMCHCKQQKPIVMIVEWTFPVVISMFVTYIRRATLE